MERLILTDVDMPAGLRQFLTANEVPPALADWRSALSQTDNIGLALRWVAALEEMEPFLEIPEVVRDAAMVAWHDGVKELLGQYTNTLEHMENLSTMHAITKYRVGLGGGPCVNFLKDKKQEGSTQPARAKGQMYQALELYEIMNVESVFGGLYS